VGEEQRQSIRKVMRVKAILQVDGAGTMAVRTMDIGTSGVGISSPHPLQTGQTGHVSFEMYFNGKIHLIGSRVKVMYCIYSSSDGFKVGLQFVNIDTAGVGTIARFMT
jgi:hypothetical protein